MRLLWRRRVTEGSIKAATAAMQTSPVLPASWNCRCCASLLVLWASRCCVDVARKTPFVTPCARCHRKNKCTAIKSITPHTALQAKDTSCQRGIPRFVLVLLHPPFTLSWNLRSLRKRFGFWASYCCDAAAWAAYFAWCHATSHRKKQCSATMSAKSHVAL